MKILRIIEVAVIVIGILYMFALSSQVNRLQKGIKKRNKKEGVVGEMSKIIAELTGKKCYLSMNDGISSETCEILDTDEEWIKVKCEGKKETIKLIRIDDVAQVQLL
ncbi:MAG: hypothetical protein RR540_05320 [Oscillospiraceae bacterium]